MPDAGGYSEIDLLAWPEPDLSVLLHRRPPPALPLSPPHTDARSPAPPPHPLEIDALSFPPQQHVQPAVAEARLLSRQCDQLVFSSASLRREAYR